jgi:hypothetical protein
LGKTRYEASVMRRSVRRVRHARHCTQKRLRVAHLADLHGGHAHVPALSEEQREREGAGERGADVSARWSRKTRRVRSRARCRRAKCSCGAHLDDLADADLELEGLAALAAAVEVAAVEQLACASESGRREGRVSGGCEHARERRRSSMRRAHARAAALTGVVRRDGVALLGRAARAGHHDLLLKVARHEVDRLDRLQLKERRHASERLGGRRRRGGREAAGQRERGELDGNVSAKSSGLSREFPRDP